MARFSLLPTQAMPACVNHQLFILKDKKDLLVDSKPKDIQDLYAPIETSEGQHCDSLSHHYP